MDQEIIQNLKRLAEQGCWDDQQGDDFVVDDYAGGNVDDAYQGGIRTGETILARDLLDKLGIPYKSPVDN